MQKIFNKQKRTICSLIKKGNTYQSIATKYGVSKQCIGDIAVATGIRSRRLKNGEARNKKLFQQIKGFILQGKPADWIQKKLHLQQSQYYYVMNAVGGHGTIRKLQKQYQRSL